MRSAALGVALAAALTGLVYSGVVLALDEPCGGRPDCFDERGPMHPALALYLTIVGALVTGAGVALARWVRPGYAAGLQLAVALVTSFPVAMQRLPDDLLVWVAPTLAEWAAFAALVVADRARDRA